jgi:hypothetical protein
MVQVGQASPPQVLLAGRDVGGSHVPATLVDDFDRVLTALESRCTESRLSTPSLADIAINVVSAAKKKGHDISHLEVLRALESSIHEGADMKIDCTDAANRLFSQFDGG